MAEIIQMNQNTWRIEDGGVRFFLLTGEDEALLIDSGMTTTNAKEIAESITDLPLKLINTHADRDHIAGNGAFSEFYMHPDEENNYIASGGQGKLLPVADGMRINLGNRELEIIVIPGHTPGSICILDVSTGELFIGDSVQNSNIFMFGAKRNFADYQKSLEKLEGLKGRFTTLYPSHGDIPLTTDWIGKLIEAASVVAQGKATGTETDVFGNKVMLYKFECAGFLCEN